MQWIHKVKIHPKMIYNRPPLNCQKCQLRFFTDQGLERHLLGSHGLVTSSMQEAANKGHDSGRCPICGKVSGQTARGEGLGRGVAGRHVSGTARVGAAAVWGLVRDWVVTVCLVSLVEECVTCWAGGFAMT